jgi:hypothetical protein
MYNQSVITTPVVLFLGAGASNPFGKMLMREFIDHLQNQGKFGNDKLFQNIIAAELDLEHLIHQKLWQELRVEEYRGGGERESSGTSLHPGREKHGPSERNQAGGPTAELCIAQQCVF